MTNAICPACEGHVSIPTDAMANELLACADCGSELEIIGLDPLELDFAPEIEEDWGE